MRWDQKLRANNLARFPYSGSTPGASTILTSFVWCQPRSQLDASGLRPRRSSRLPAPPPSICCYDNRLRDVVAAVSTMSPRLAVGTAGRSSSRIAPSSAAGGVGA